MAPLKKCSGGTRSLTVERHQTERNCDANRSTLNSTGGMMGEAGVPAEKGCSEAKNQFILKSASVSALEGMRRIHDDPLEGCAGLPQTSEPDDGIGSEESLMRNSGYSGSEKDGSRCQIFSSSSSLPLADQGSCVFSSIDSLSSLPQCASTDTILKNPIATCGPTVVSGGVTSEHPNLSSALKTEVNHDFQGYLVCCSVDSCVSASNFYKLEMMSPGSGMVDSVLSSASEVTVVANCSCADGESCICFRADEDGNRVRNHLQAGARCFSDSVRRSHSDVAPPCPHLQEDLESNGSGKCMMSEDRNETKSYESCSKYDSKYLLGLAFDQTRRFKNGYMACSVHSDAEDFRRFTAICESSSELSVSMSSRSCSQNNLVRLSAECGCDGDRFRLSGRRVSAPCSFGTSQSDSVIAVLDLETTGDYPRGFRFQSSGGLLSPPATAPIEIEKPGHHPGRSAVVHVSVASDHEREMDEEDDIVVLHDDVDEDSVTIPLDNSETVETTKRNLLRRFLDMTAGVLLGFPVIETGGCSEGAGHRIKRSRSTLVSSRDPVGDDDVRPRSCSASDVPLCPRSAVRGRTAPEFVTAIERGCQKETQSKLPMQEESSSQQENLLISNELGKSQSVETASMQRSSTAGGGMAQRSLDSTWPPNLSRGSSMSTQSEKPGVDRSTPQKMVKYKVAEGDTLTSIAARFECLPTEVMKANRMGTRLVFPGQVLTVPARASSSSRLQDSSSAASGHVSGVGDDCVFLESNEDLAAGGSDASAAAGGGRLQAAAGGSSKQPDKYIKVKSRHITDGQGVVSGTLLITPNCLMFDPNVSDPLVLEHGADQYGVIVPLDYIVSAAMYNDIAHMRVKDRADIQLPDLPIPEVYHPAEPSAEPAAGVESSDQSSRPPSLTAVDNSPKMKRPSTPPPSLEDLSATPPLAAEDQLATAEPTEAPSTLQDVSEESTPSEVGSLRQPLPDVVDSAVASESASTVVVAAVTGGGSEQLEADGGPAPAAAAQSVQFSPPPTSGAAAAAERLDEFDASTKQKVWKRLSHPLTWMESFSGSQEREGATPPNSAPPTQTEAAPKSMLSNMYSSVTSVSSAIASSPRYIADLGSGLLSSLSPAEPEEAGAAEPGLPDPDARCEGNSMFYSQRSSVEKRSRSQSGFSGYINLVGMEEKPLLFTPFDKLIPQPSTASDDPPLYLCLLMGKPAGRRLHKSVRIITYGEPKLRAEIWFSIPKDKCDHIYGFFQYWVPELYGSLETTNPESRGFELVDSDTELWEEEETEYELVAGRGGSPEDGSGLMDIPRQLPKQSWEMGDMSEEVCRALQISMDMEFTPDLIGKSEVLTEDIRKTLAKKLPPRVEGYPWRLVFSSSEHGFSLKSLYRKSSAYESPMLLVVQDTEGHVFGAVSSCTIQMSEHYYGTGETFLYSFHPHFCVYRWSGENNYYIRGTTDGLEFGSGDGHYGLYLDSDLYRGRTQPCITFRNQSLTTSDDFIIKAIELWGLT